MNARRISPLVFALPRLLVGLLVAFLAGLPTACNTADNLAPLVFGISYVVESTGGAATVTQVDYIDTSGTTQTVMNPVLPWTLSASRSEGESAQLVVTGTTGVASTIVARIQDDPALVTSPATYATGTCAENIDPCTIDVSHGF